jgi:hypothetical protein
MRTLSRTTFTRIEKSVLEHEELEYEEYEEYDECRAIWLRLSIP